MISTDIDQDQIMFYNILGINLLILWIQSQEPLLLCFCMEGIELHSQWAVGQA